MSDANIVYETGNMELIMTRKEIEFLKELKTIPSYPNNKRSDFADLTTCIPGIYLSDVESRNFNQRATFEIFGNLFNLELGEKHRFSTISYRYIVFQGQEKDGTLYMFGERILKNPNPLKEG